MRVLMDLNSNSLKCGHCGVSMITEFEDTVPVACFCANPACSFGGARYLYPTHSVKPVDAQPPSDTDRRVAELEAAIAHQEVVHQAQLNNLREANLCVTRHSIPTQED